MSLKNLLKQAKQSPSSPSGRNLVALNPLLKKGGVHDVDDTKARHKKSRQASKLTLKRQDWA